jgi:lipopolysaccharide transport system ATP-binding protein
MGSPVNNSIAISLRNVSKKYQLYNSPNQRFLEALHPFKKKYHREFWALRDINLEIPRGATVGILGVNGSGKSTLLQIICSILQPTSGTVEVHGKVAALIELGAGFNPDLTGRENAEINCAIQGLDAQTVRDKLPEIEAFADIGDFFDQPVKTYSSGMFMRVAFATAISVDPDILIIDEALAVGDARFQQKCFAKFRDFQEAGKTILLVTHDRFSIPRLCSSAVLLNQGRLILNSSPIDVVARYAELLSGGEQESKSLGNNIEALRKGGADNRAAEQVDDLNIHENPINIFMQSTSSEDNCHNNPTFNKNEYRYGNQKARIVDYILVVDGATNPLVIQAKSTVDLYLKVFFDEIMCGFIFGMNIKTKDGVLIYGNNTFLQALKMEPGKPGEIKVFKVTFQANFAPSDVFLGFGVAETQEFLSDIRENCAHLKIIDDSSYTGLVSLPISFTECQ